MRALEDVKVALALAGMTGRYRATVAAPVRNELAHWQRRAEEVEDPRLRALAVAKLREERFNAQAAAMFATLTPRQGRRSVVRAVVALEVLFDYLDGRAEQAAAAAEVEPRTRLFEPFHNALWATAPVPAQGLDGPYVSELAETVRSVVDGLPWSEAVRGQMRAAAERASAAQVRVDASGIAGRSALREWAEQNASGSGLGWREYAAGCAASVVEIHALIAAAACSEPADVGEIERCYLRVCALATLLDGIVDRDEDLRTRVVSYASFYPSAGELGEAVLTLARQAFEHAQQLRRRSREVALVAGLLAFYLTSPGANGPQASQLLRPLRSEHRRLLAPAIGVLWVWRRT
jgi:tetraprenyl-beta-curcumene synthase